MSRLLALFVALLGLLCLACGGSEGGENPGKALAQVGYGAADTWHLPGSPGPDEIARAGLGLVVIEHFPTVQDKDWRKGELLVSFPEQAKEVSKRACENGQSLVVFLVNWNVLPFRRQPDSWFAEVLNEALSIYDPACTWLEAVVEPDEGDLSKARRWTQLARDAWPGKFLVPAAAVGWGIRGDFIDYHPAGVKDASKRLGQFPPGWILITDGGDFSSPPDIFGAYGTLAKEALAAGVPLIFYQDRWNPGMAGHRRVLDEIAGAIRE
jgi:hypothetical protein